MLVLNILTPVFGVVLIGAVLARTGFLSRSFLQEANRVTYWLGLPALLFTELIRSFHSSTTAAPNVLVAMLLATVSTLGIAWMFARLAGLERRRVGTFVQGAFRGNLAFVGLPVLYAFPADSSTAPAFRQLAVLVVAPAMVFYNAASTVMLLLDQHRLRANSVGPLVKRLATTPPLVATVLGVAFAVTGLDIPAPIGKCFELLGMMALPLGLLCVGGSLAEFRLSQAWGAGAASALIKTLVSPGLGWLAARLLGLQLAETRVIVVFMACPTAIVSYAVAVELGGDGALASSIIAVSSLASALVLGVVVAGL